jgi:hypothetical protein
MAVKKPSVTNKIEAARRNVRAFREKREILKTLEKEVKDDQPEIIAVLKTIGVDNEVGVVYDADDKSKGAAYVQQNSATEFWDEEAIIDLVRKDKALWMSVSSRVLDLQKFEAEVANGNIPAKVATKLKRKSDPPKPFIRFGKITDKSL